MVEMEILARHPVLGKHLATDGLHTLQVARLGDEHGYLAKLLILLLGQHKGGFEMPTEQVFHLLYLYLDTTAAYHIILPALDAEEDVGG